MEYSICLEWPLWVTFRNGENGSVQPLTPLKLRLSRTSRLSLFFLLFSYHLSDSPCSELLGLRTTISGQYDGRVLCDDSVFSLELCGVIIVDPYDECIRSDRSEICCDRSVESLA